MISAIYAVSENKVIGKDNALPWHLPADLQHFKQITLGKTIIMGRKTFESMGRPLPKRRNIVVSRDKNWKHEGVETATSLEAAFALTNEEAEVCIIGGAGLFQAAFEQNYITHIYQTLVHAEVEGDIFFTLPKPEQWKVVAVEAHQADEKNEYAYTFISYEL